MDGTRDLEFGNGVNGCGTFASHAFLPSESSNDYEPYLGIFEIAWYLYLIIEFKMLLNLQLAWLRLLIDIEFESYMGRQELAG